MPGGGQASDIEAKGDKPKEKLVNFAPSASSDGMLGFIGNHDERVGLQVGGVAFVGNKRGGVAARPPEPSDGGAEGCSRSCGDGPPGPFGVGCAWHS